MSTPPALDVQPPDVAVWLRARTQDDEGREVGLFTEATRPTVSQVQQAIEVAHALVAMRVGYESPVPCLEAYRHTVALAAACQIEKSYFPEQIADNRSAYVQLNEELGVALENLYRCVVDGGLGPSPGTDEGGAGAGFDICTPVVHCGEQGWPFVPANWNNPYADDIDDEGAPTQAQAWLLEQNRTVWQGQVDADGEPIPNFSPLIDTRGGS